MKTCGKQLLGSIMLEQRQNAQKETNRLEEVNSEADVWQSAPLNLALPIDRLDLWRIPLQRRPAELNLSPCLSADEIARANRFHFERDRTRFAECRKSVRDI